MPAPRLRAPVDPLRVTPPRRAAAACGHPLTLAASTRILESGGNAFDAAAAGAWCACVAEPLLASPGGGGFLLARVRERDHRLYDFFVQTPRERRPAAEVDFREIVADFGPAQQGFGIGLGTAATPGLVAGIFRFHGELGRMPTREVMAPAVEAARTGVPVNRMQAYVAAVLTPILESTPGVRAVFAPGGRVVREGELVRQPHLADLLESLGREGPALFYRGEVAAQVDRASREEGGHLRMHDFESYRVLRRRPLDVSYGGDRIWTNPPPASGGLLIAFGLRVLAGLHPQAARSEAEEARRVALALAAMQEARTAERLAEGVDARAAARVLSPGAASRYLAAVRSGPRARGGTTHISVVDADGGAASITLSNGEGSGWVVSGTGVMLNNMLGEVDLQPHGFGRWPTDTRLTSMMAPTLAEAGHEGRLLVLGSGGSNRIRSAILQVLSGVLDHDLSVAEAVRRPRLHVEGERLEIEGGHRPETVAALARDWPDARSWPERNLFFGGVHAVDWRATGVAAAGDPRRGGRAATRVLR